MNKADQAEQFARSGFIGIIHRCIGPPSGGQGRIENETWDLEPKVLREVLSAALDVGYSHLFAFEYEKDPEDPVPGLEESVG